MNAPKTTPRSLRSTNPNDRGYKPSPATERLMDSITLEMIEDQLERHNAAELAQSQVGQSFTSYVADVLDQYTAEYYADDEPGQVALIASRLSQLTIPIFYRNIPDLLPDPTTIEAMFDDVYTLDGRAFCTKYDILDFYEMRHDELKTDERTWDEPYQQLVKHLDPLNPAAARQRIDQAILDYKRAEAQPMNRRSALSIFVYLIALLTAAPAVFRVMTTMEHHAGELAFIDIAASLSWPMTITLFVATFALITLSVSLRYPSKRPPPAPPPAFIKAWFDRRERPGHFQHWHIYWPTPKLWIHRREGYFFYSWRKQLATREDYEGMIAKLERKNLFRKPNTYMANQLRRFLETNTDRYP
jgi:hypothetical protein